MKNVLCFLFVTLLLARAEIFSNQIVAAANEPAVTPKKLNVLLVMADDLRDFGGAFTKDVIKMPHLDRLRSRGTTFERAYVQYPVCNPSRSSLMTGLRSHDIGIISNGIPLRNRWPVIITLPELCKNAGWQSHAFGEIYGQRRRESHHQPPRA